MAQRGFPLTRRIVMEFAWAISLRSGQGDRFNTELDPGDHWWSNFRTHHPKLTLRKVNKLDKSRAESLDPEVVREYFELRKNILTEHGLKNSPRCIYNCNETFLPLDGTREKAVTVKNAKSTYAQQLSTLLCAAGMQFLL